MLLVIVGVRLDGKKELVAIQTATGSPRLLGGIPKTSATATCAPPS